MARKKRSRERNNSPGTLKDLQRKKTSPLADFLSGSNAKWVFFAIFFLVTVFIFREFLFGDGMLFGSDTMPDGIYTRKYYKEYHAEYGGIPKWNPFILGGLPFIDAMHGDTFYPAAWLKFFMPLTRALGHKLVWHVFLAGIAMYIFLRTLRLRRDASFLGGLMYMLAPSFISLVYPAHDAKMYVIAWLPLAFALLETGMNIPTITAFTALGGVMGLLVLTSHAQMAYYSYWAIGLYFLFRLATSGDKTPAAIIRRSALFSGAVIIALALGAVQLFPAYKFSTSQSVRAGAERTGYEYATSWSMHPEEAAGMIVPSFQGNTFWDGRTGDLYRSDLYWGRNTFKLNTEYHGILPIIFAVMALIFRRRKETWFFLGLSLFSLVYALGANTPFYRLFYALVPGVKNFRAPGMIIFLFCFAVVIIAARFISEVLDGEALKNKGDKTLLYAVGALFFAALIVSGMGDGFFGLWKSKFYSDLAGQKEQAMLANVGVFTADLWRIVILSGAALAGVWMFVTRRIGSTALVVLLALVTLIDDAVVDNRFVTVINPATFPVIVPDQTTAALREKTKTGPPFRILGLLSGKNSTNYYAMFGIQAADGAHNNELQRYELFRGGRNSENFTSGWLSSGNIEGIKKNNFLKVAGVRYIVVGNQSGGSSLLENEGALPRAYIVHDYVIAGSDTATVAMLHDMSFDPAVTAIIDNEHTVPFAAAAVTTPVSTVERLDYTKDGAVIEAVFSAPGLLVLTDNYVPYWRAFVDSEQVPVHRAFGTFMAVACGEGRHEIRFSYLSQPYEKGKKVTLAAAALVFLWLAAASGIHLRRKKQAG